MSVDQALQPPRRPLRVANITEEGRYGGPQARITEVAARLYEQGIDTTVIHPQAFAEIFQQRLDAKHVKHRGVPLHLVTRQRKRLVEYVATFVPEIVGLVRELGSGRYDLVHCNGSWQVKGAIAARLLGLPTVWHLNDTYAPKVVRIAFECIASLCADGYIVAGERVAEYYLTGRGEQGKPTFEIQAPVDTGVFDPQAVLPHPRVASLPGLKVVTVANVNPIKGLETLLEITSRFLREPVSFVVAGATYDTQREYATSIQESARARNLKNLHFLGHVDDIASVLKAADVYVCTSRFEASPIAIWEAMAMALPIVSTDVGDVARIFREHPCGYVVAVGDVEASVAHLRRLVAHEALRRTKGTLARRVAQEHFDIASCAMRHLACYQQMRVVKCGRATLGGDLARRRM